MVKKKITKKSNGRARAGRLAVAALPARIIGVLRRNRRLAAMLLFAAAILLVGASVYASQMARHPVNILRQALAESMQASSAKVGLQLNTRSVGQQPALWRVDGSVGVRGRFQLTGEYTKDGSTVYVDANSPEGRDAYLRMRGVGGLSGVLGAEAAQYGISVASNPALALENKWLTIPADLKETVIWNHQSSADDANDLDDRDRRTLADLYGKHEFMTVSQIYSEATIDGVASHHYGLDLDETKLRNFLEAVQRELPKLGVTAKQVDGLVSAAAQTESLDVWISKLDGRFNRIDYRAQAGDDGDTFSLRISDYDAALNLRAPTDATPLFEALTNMRLETEMSKP